MSYTYTKPSFPAFCEKLSEQRTKQGLPMDEATLLELYNESIRLGYIPMEAYGPKGPIIDIKPFLEYRRKQR